MSWLEEIRWNADGLVAAIAQDADDGRVLMMAWMDRAALAKTHELGEAVYYSRSRDRLWHKGESSGHVQRVRSMRLDCDGDAILLAVEQRGGIACHTGRRSCFHRRLDDGSWYVDERLIRDPRTIYAGEL